LRNLKIYAAVNEYSPSQVIEVALEKLLGAVPADPQSAGTAIPTLGLSSAVAQGAGASSRAGTSRGQGDTESVAGVLGSEPGKDAPVNATSVGGRRTPRVRPSGAVPESSESADESSEYL
jgi:hypothetical protein